MWLELTAVAIREGDPYRAVAAQITVMFLNWIKTNLTITGTPEREEAAAFVLAFVEGLILLNAIDKAEEAKRALDWA